MENTILDVINKYSLQLIDAKNECMPPSDGIDLPPSTGTDTILYLVRCFLVLKDKYRIVIDDGHDEGIELEILFLQIDSPENELREQGTRSLKNSCFIYINTPSILYGSNKNKKSKWELRKEDWKKINELGITKDNFLNFTDTPFYYYDDIIAWGTIKIDTKYW